MPAVVYAELARSQENKSQSNYHRFTDTLEITILKQNCVS